MGLLTVRFGHRGMDLCQHSLCRTTLLLCLNALLCWEMCVGQRVVEMQKGPLYRAVGYPIKISCNVSGFGGPPQQDFGFSIYKSNRPAMEIKIISTFDANFAYAVYSQRVRAKQIEIQRLSGSSVFLHIKTLEQGDAGEYECQTPNTDGRYFGSYSAKTTLNVVQDTLSVSSSPAILSKSEEDSLQLECEVSSQTFQHTHLSVTWFLRKSEESEPRPIISLSRDFSLRAGEDFDDRYRAGIIGLDKLGDTTYRLRVSQLQVSDQGSIYCEASEWIQDPDRSWFKIAYKSSEMFTVKVQSLDVTSDSDLFTARVDVPKANLLEGDALEVRCIVEADNIQDRYLSVAWLKANKEVAAIGPTGVPSVMAGLAQREREGELKVVKKSDRDYVLTVRPARTGDAGDYQCRVWEEEKASGSFTRRLSQESDVVHVTITVTESNLAVSTPNSTVTLTEGDVLRLTCSASGTNSPLSVSWQHRAGQSSFSDVISLSHSGVMEVGLRYRQRAEVGDVRTLRNTPDSFTLEIANALLADSGEYKCTVSEWVMEAKGELKRGDSKSQEMTADVHSVDSLLRATLKSRTVRVTEGEAMELFCTVKGPQVPVSVTWKFRHLSAVSQEDIVSLFYTGAITWWKERRNYQFRAQVQPSEASYVLRVYRASQQEAGKYQCVIEAYLRHTQRSLKLSNELAVSVVRPASQLSISTSPDSLLEWHVGADVQVQCNVLTATSNSSHFAMSWIFKSHGQANRTILATDRDSVVVTGMGPKYSLRRREARSYELLLQKAEIGDGGLYYCQVEEWLQDPHGVWYSLPPKTAEVEIIIIPERRSFSVLKAVPVVRVEESGQVSINCTLATGAAMPSSLYSVTWFFTPEGSSERVELVKLNHNGVLQPVGTSEELMNRMRFHRPAPGAFSLTIQNAGTDDSGQYSCQLDEYQLDGEGKWLQKASDQSGVTSVTVLQTESNLHVVKANDNITISSQQDRFIISCNISSYSSTRSVFEVTWWWRQATGEREPHPIFRASRDSTLQHLDKTRDPLLFGRPQATLYTLTVPNAEPADSGQYYCHVEEWLLSPRDTWRKVAEETSGYLTVSVQTQEGSHFSVMKPDVQVKVEDSGQVSIDCILGSGGATAQSLYSITWFFTPEGSSERMALAKFSHDGVLQPMIMDEELMMRIRFHRPALGAFSLTIQNAGTDDSGQYSCQVDEYQLDGEGKWVQKASDQSGVTSVTVLQTESNLHVVKANDNITISNQKDNFTISCNMSSYSSTRSVFEVTWWWQQADGEREPHPIFRASRDSTLQHLDKTRDPLLFGRPQATLYTLTVPNAEPADSGQYYCHVEEWLLSPRDTWRKVAEETSGYLTVSVQIQGAREGPRTTMLIGVFTVFMVLLLVFIGFLLYKLRMVQNPSASAKKKTVDSLWAEGDPLKPKPEL